MRTRRGEMKSARNHVSKHCIPHVDGDWGAAQGAKPLSALAHGRYVKFSPSGYFLYPFRRDMVSRNCVQTTGPTRGCIFQRTAHVLPQVEDACGRRSKQVCLANPHLTLAKSVAAPSTALAPLAKAAEQLRVSAAPPKASHAPAVCLRCF